MKTKDLEEWRDVVGYEGAYQISDAGGVRNSRTGDVLQPLPIRGYRRVDLCRDGIVRGAGRSLRELAARFCVSAPTISEIAHRRIWRHV